jgi:catechol 2,3-dioxygenase-like lactoylglutathione lyase family enzyme
VDKFDIPRRGTSQHGLATRDADGTIAFVEGVLGFPLVCVSREAEGSPRAGTRQLYFGIGADEYLVYTDLGPWTGEGEDPHAVLAETFHWAFQGGNDSTLESYRQRLLSNGHKVTEIVQTGTMYPDGHKEEMMHSIYFRDPVNGFLMEFTVPLRDFQQPDLDNHPWFSENHTGPAFFEAFLGTERWEKRRAAMAAAAGASS